MNPEKNTKEWLRQKYDEERRDRKRWQEHLKKANERIMKMEMKLRDLVNSTCTERNMSWNPLLS